MKMLYMDLLMGPLYIGGRGITNPSTKADKGGDQGGAKPAPTKTLEGRGHQPLPLSNKGRVWP
jgi:hypothetical protein